MSRKRKKPDRRPKPPAADAGASAGDPGTPTGAGVPEAADGHGVADGSVAADGSEVAGAPADPEAAAGTSPAGDGSGDPAASAQSAPDALPARPGHLYVAIAVVALEALALVAVAGAFIVLAVTAGTLLTSLLALGIMFAILGLGMVAVTRSLWVMHRWARPAGIAWQVLQALFGISTFQAGPLLGLAAIVPAVVFLYAIFQPRVLYAFEDAIAYHEAHPAAPAPPPKRW